MKKPKSIAHLEKIKAKNKAKAERDLDLRRNAIPVSAELYDKLKKEGRV